MGRRIYRRFSLCLRLLGPTGAGPARAPFWCALVIQIILIFIMFTCIGWRIKTPKTSFEILHQLVQADIPAQLKQPRKYWQIKNRVNKRGQQLGFIDYYELPPYL